MKTWIGLALALIGLALGLASTMLTNFAASHPERANVIGIPTESIASNSPSAVGLSLLVLIISFCLVFSTKKRHSRN